MILHLANQIYQREIRGKANYTKVNLHLTPWSDGQWRKNPRHPVTGKTLHWHVRDKLLHMRQVSKPFVYIVDFNFPGLYGDAGTDEAWTLNPTDRIQRLYLWDRLIKMGNEMYYNAEILNDSLTQSMASGTAKALDGFRKALPDGFLPTDFDPDPVVQDLLAGTFG